MSTHYKVKEKRVAGTMRRYIRVCHDFPIDGDPPKSFTINGHTYHLERSDGDGSAGEVGRLPT